MSREKITVRQIYSGDDVLKNNTPLLSELKKTYDVDFAKLPINLEENPRLIVKKLADARFCAC